MQDSAFDPDSPNLNVHWVTAYAVSSFDTWNLLGEILPDSDSACKLRFLRIFGHLSSDMESWNMLNLALLQVCDPGLKPLKHALCKHWLEVARLATTDIIPAKPSSICVLKRHCEGHVIGFLCMGHTDPFAFNRNLQNSLRLLDVRPLSRLQDGMIALLSLDFGWNEDGAVHTFQAANRTEEGGSSIRYTMGCFTDIALLSTFHPQ